MFYIHNIPFLFYFVYNWSTLFFNKALIAKQRTKQRTRCCMSYLVAELDLLNNDKSKGGDTNLQIISNKQSTLFLRQYYLKLYIRLTGVALWALTLSPS